MSVCKKRVKILTNRCNIFLQERFDYHSFVQIFKNPIQMKFILALVVVLSSLSLNAKSLDVSTHDFSSVEQTAASSHIDKKKSRRHKKMNKKRKKACSNWAKRSYAG